MINRPSLISTTFAAIGILLLMVHFFLYDQFFPNDIGGLGHDYSSYLPKLLDGVFWHQNNGWLSIPWFTPSFCGGLPIYANPNGGFYSVPQFLSFIVSPLSSVKWTLLIFSGLGYSGFYILLRRIFETTRLTALLGATLFLFNGFYFHRMIIGHLTFHPFMLIPWIAYLNLRIVPKQKTFAKMRESFNIVVAGVLVAYMFFAGMIHVIIPSLISVAVIGLIRQFRSNSSLEFIQFSLKLFLTCAIALALCASKLWASWAYLKHFPRDFYPLPGIPNVFDILMIVFNSLFWEPAFQLAQAVRVNFQFQLQRHEYELGVSLVPLILIIAGILLRIRSKDLFRSWKIRRHWVYLGMIVIFLSLPIVVNFYTPGWNAILKQIPLIQNSSTLVRWYSIYIPIIILLAALLLDRTPILQRYAYPIVMVSIFYVVISNIFVDRNYYHTQKYNHRGIEMVYQQSKKGLFNPQITELSSNKSFIQHASQFPCYAAIYGYNLESFPLKTLHKGSPWEQRNGFLNVKNPVCYLFPEENQCKPGDHFTTGQIQEAQLFLNYRPFPFKFSLEQKIANYFRIYLVGGGGFYLFARVKLGMQDDD